MSFQENQNCRVMAEAAVREQDREREQPRDACKAKVRFFGDDIGFQFSQTCNGSSSRLGKITNIHIATPEELQIIFERHQTDNATHKMGSKGQFRGIPCDHSESFMILVGESFWRFRSESKRLVKVACSICVADDFLAKYTVTLEAQMWQSICPIYEDEGEEEELQDYEKEYGDYTK